MKLSGVRLSVRPSVPSFAHRCRGFAAERRAARRCQSTAAAAAAPQHGAQLQTPAVPHCQLKREAEHRLVEMCILQHKHKSTTNVFRA